MQNNPQPPSTTDAQGAASPRSKEASRGEGSTAVEGLREEGAGVVLMPPRKSDCHRQGGEVKKCGFWEDLGHNREENQNKEGSCGGYYMSIES